MYCMKDSVRGGKPCDWSQTVCVVVQHEYIIGFPPSAVYSDASLFRTPLDNLGQVQVS